MNTEGKLISTNYFALGITMTLGIMSLVILWDSKAPWLGYTVFGACVLNQILTQKRVSIDRAGIATNYFLRPFRSRRFIPLNAVNKAQWKSGYYAASSFARLWYDQPDGTVGKIDVILDPTEWQALVQIIKEGNSSASI